jgi:hypothetical protein
MTLNPYLVSSLLLYGISTLSQSAEKLIAKRQKESLLKGYRRRLAFEFLNAW